MKMTRICLIRRVGTGFTNDASINKRKWKKSTMMNSKTQLV